MTVAWAGVERMIDELIGFHQHHHTDLSGEHPRSLSNKLEYLKKMQKHPAYPWGAQNFFRVLRITGKRLGNERHEIIHGVLRRSGRSVVWRSQRVIYQGAVARLSHREFHNDDIIQIMKDIGSFGTFVSPRVAFLVGIDLRSYPPSQIEEVRRELLRTFPPVKIP